MILKAKKTSGGKIFIILVVTMMMGLFSQSSYAGKQEQMQAAQEFMRREAPYILRQLQNANEAEKDVIIESFGRTIVGDYFEELPIDEKKNAILQVLIFLENELVQLEGESKLQKDIQELSPQQECVNRLNLEFLSRNPEESWMRIYLSRTTLERLDIEASPESMEEGFKKHGTIQLRRFVDSPEPKLIVACGHGCQKKTACGNPHFSEDTIDPLIKRNPTVVGLFGKSSVLPSDHYQTIYDEGPIDFSPEFWSEAERILKPGGFLVFQVNDSMTRVAPPEDTKLKLISIIAEPGYGTHYPIEKCHCTIDKYHRRLAKLGELDGVKENRPWDVYPWDICATGYQYTIAVMAKQLPDGSFPVEIREKDLPSGMVLYEQWLPPFNPKQRMEKQFLQTYKALHLGGNETAESKMIKDSLR